MKITICMGSSCFARGNGRNLDTINRFLEKIGGTHQVEVTGSRCSEMCNEGPNITIDSVAYHRVDAGVLLDLLRQHTGGVAGSSTPGQEG